MSQQEPSDAQRVVWALEGIEASIDALAADVREAGLRWGPATPETTASVESPAPASESDQDLSEIAPSVRSKLAEVGFPLAELDVSYMPEQSAVRIHTKDGFDVTDEWREWTAERFGKGKPGDILWGTYEKEDGSEGYYPEAYDIPLHAVPEVLEG